LRLWTKQHPLGVAEHGSARSEPASTVEVDNRSSPAEAGVDHLTGVLSRVLFEARLSEELERTRGFDDCFVLVFFDIDEFGALNGAHGRQKGDDALVLMAQVLRSNARRVDVVARYGSDEFVVLMPRTSLVGARDFFEKIRAEVAERSMLELGFSVHLSAGAVKLLHDITGDPQYLLETASYAMYVAKRQGKDRLFTTVAVGHAENGREADPGA
jgi:diguanylate cyclase (GGDEF)-like protein